MDYIKETLKLAKKGLGRTSPNPMVGAVIVKNEKIVGKGYHKRKGEPHAEIIALKEAGAIFSKGATLYVNLEPCCHFGTTPPCTQAIISAGIKEVHIGIEDPSPWVNGKGIKELKKAGIEIILGECEQEANELNEAYFKWVKTGIPFVNLKAAITLDGKIADSKVQEFKGSNKGSRWITNERSRKFVHRLRSQVDAVIVGVGTVIADDPELTVRWGRGRNPLCGEGRGEPKRIILDSHLRIPRDAKVLGDGCIIASIKKPTANSQQLTVWQIKKDANGRVDILEVLKRAGKENIQSILIEGGREVFTESLSRGIVDKVYFFIAPKLLGSGVPVIGDLGIEKLESALSLTSVKFRKFGEDVLIEGNIQ
ncbi:bifunctional diaminohydroxyphosphoribosylaminopyrimidine deaminase/5-amino-6-(5-phosphoribosylamino)uracil reductase RibD [candidate division WOR-3 bacterium]|nr:bifunctional diaminohydroxyphosphoribosylaminopyrimidine deaminase/5-amino-6-(5-phosphoribosylamino)uracil reductase RibD [candidate division WOR-3 bacterium]